MRTKENVVFLELVPYSFCSDFQFFTFFNVILSTRWRGGVKCSFLVAVTMKSWVQTPVRDFLLLFFSI